MRSSMMIVVVGAITVSIVMAASDPLSVICGGPLGLKCGGTDCCSQWGYCGSNPDYCGDSCQSAFGTCNDMTVKTATPTVAPGAVGFRERCGAQFGSCTNNQCCSQYNYCGDSPDFCSTGCQSQFGSCGMNINPAPRPPVATPAPTYSRMQCGEGIGKCDPGLCCSQYGWCGSAVDFCSYKCQPNFGTCPAPTTRVATTRAATRAATTAAMKADAASSSVCGPAAGNIKCAAGQCCSQYGYCGTSAAHCTSGCQSGFGTCTSAATTKPISNLFTPYIRYGAFRVNSYANLIKTYAMKSVTIAFVVSTPTGRPTWGATMAPIDFTNQNDGVLQQIRDIRAIGASFVLSFGGATGPSLAETIFTDTALLSAYQSIVTFYGATFVDFDVEGSALENTVSVQRRNRVLAQLQKANPNLKLSFTLPVWPTGMSPRALFVLSDALAKGVQFDAVNIMTMDYYLGYSIDMGQGTISAGAAARRQIINLGSTACVGLIPMLGVNDDVNLVFTLANAQAVVNYASNPANGICIISFWSGDRDFQYLSGVKQTDFQFTSIFAQFK